MSENTHGQRVVVITGASTGIGRATALLLDYFDAKVKDLPSISAKRAAFVLARALTDTKPKRRYVVGPGARKMSVLSYLPAGVRDRMLAKAIYGRST